MQNGLREKEDNANNGKQPKQIKQQKITPTQADVTIEGKEFPLPNNERYISDECGIFDNISFEILFGTLWHGLQGVRMEFWVNRAKNP